MIAKHYAVPFEQDGQRLYLTALDVRTILGIAEVDEWDPDLDPVDDEYLAKQGYQRTPVKSHLASIARYFNSEVSPLLPTSILLSARGKLELVEQRSGGFGKLRIPKESHPLYIVDGQHRVKGIEYAAERYGMEHLLDFPLPVTIMEEMPKAEEIQQFFTINTTAKRIRTDLAQRLLLELAEQDDSIMDLAVQQGKKWRLRATKITTELSERPGSPWYGRVKAPNASGRSEAVATETTLANSLQPILTGSFVGRYEDEKVILVMQRLWEAIGELMPEAIHDPGSYVLQKTPGIYTIHMLAPKIFEVCRDNGDLSVKGMKAILTTTEESRGYFANEEFWRGRAAGGVEAATYNGMGAFRQLADDIERTLPELRLDLSI